MNKRTWFRLAPFAVVVAVAVFAVGCSTRPKKIAPVAAPYDAKKELGKVQIDVAAGADRKAIGRLKALIAKHPKSDVADDATLMMARIQFKQGQFDAAYKTYMSLVESDVFSPNEAEAVLGAARCLHKLGRLDESLAISSRGLKIPGLSDQAKLEFYRHRYALLAVVGDRLDALRALAFIHAKDPKADVRENAQARALEIVNRGLSERDLETVVGDPEFGFVRAPAALRLGWFRLQQKDYDGARSQFARAAEWGQGTPVQATAESYVAQLDARRKVDASTIGAVLPLTGRYESYAQKTLRGLQLGLGIVGPDKSRFRLAVVDSEGSPESARKAVERLVVEDSVIAIVGSLLSRDAAAVARKADELGVPSIALSQKSGLTEIGPYVFRNAVTSEMQVRELARVAMDQLGLKRFAILYPNDSYGVEYANLFWDEVLARGGSIAGAQPYSPKETDFRGPIRRLVGTYYVEDRRVEYQARLKEYYKKQKSLKSRQSPPDDLLPPVVDFEAIFIPDTPKSVGQISAMLAYLGVQGARLMGTNVWNTSDLVRRGQKNVERSLFVDTNFLNDPGFRSSRFFKDFQKTFGEEPGLFETQGFEVGVMLRRLIERGETSRVGLAQALTNLGQFQAVSSPMTMTPRRELERPLSTFTVSKESIVMWTPEIEKEAEVPADEPADPKRRTKRPVKRQ